MKVLAVFMVSWLAGLGAYLLSLAVVYRQAVSFGDLLAVMFWSVLAYAVAFFLLYLPALTVLRRLMGGVCRLWPFPLLAILLGLVPTSGIVLYWGGSIRALATPEAFLFLLMFAAAGLVVGISYALIHRMDDEA